VFDESDLFIHENLSSRHKKLLFVTHSGMDNSGRWETTSAVIIHACDSANTAIVKQKECCVALIERERIVFYKTFNFKSKSITKVLDFILEEKLDQKTLCIY